MEDKVFCRPFYETSQHITNCVIMTATFKQRYFLVFLSKSLLTKKTGWAQ